MRILEHLLADGVDAADVARVLQLSPEALDEVRAGRLALPLWRQVVVASLAEAVTPRRRGEVAALRAQLRATLEFRAGTTIVHSDSPVLDR